MFLGSRASLLSGVAFAAVALSTSASAQTTPAPGAPVAPNVTASAVSPPPTSDSTVGDIIVTANKRSENANRVGLSITSVSGAELAERKITSLSDIAAAVPGLVFSPSTTNTPIFTLRGVGFNESSLGVYPAVSVYLDQAPLPFPVMASHSAFDLERIEVLKGPQGTLFGQNSTGGAINYIAAKPTNVLSAGGDISYGRFNQIDGNAFVSGPITPNLGFRVAVTGLRSDDWQYSITRNDTNGHQSYIAGRVLLDWNPSDRLTFALNVNGWIDKSQPQAQQLIAIIPQIPGSATPRFLASPFAPNNARAADWTDQALDPATGVVGPSGAVTPGTESLTSFDPFGDRKFYQLSLRGDYVLGGGVTLTEITTYDRYNQRQATDGDGNALVAFDLPKNDGYLRSFNQEVRLASTSNSRFHWVVGANYESSQTFENQILRFYDDSNYNPQTLYINAAAVTNHQSIRNIAGFGNVDFKVLDQLTVHGGLRYTDSRNTADICPYTITGGNVDKLFNVLGGLVGDVPFTPVVPSNPNNPTSCYALDNLTQTIPGRPDNVPGRRFDRVLAEHNLSYKFGIDYQVQTDTLVYGNISRGYKAGSFPSLAASNFQAILPVTQESLTAYEIGIKTQLFDRRLSFTSAAFYYDYKNKQVRGKLADPIFGALDALINVPKSRIYGVEADATLRIIPGLTINGAVTYLNSKVLDYTNAVNTVGQTGVSFDGSPLPFTPKWSGSVNLDYRYALTNSAAIFAGATVQARTNSDAVLGAHQINVQAISTAIVRAGVGDVYGIDGYATVDGRLGYEAPGGKFRVSVWGKNIFNKYYWTTVIPASDSAARLAGMPATYGITFGVKY